MPQSLAKIILHTVFSTKDPLTISTLGKAARALGRKIKIELVPA